MPDTTVSQFIFYLFSLGPTIFIIREFWAYILFLIIGYYFGSHIQHFQYQDMMQEYDETEKRLEEEHRRIQQIKAQLQMMHGVVEELGGLDRLKRERREKKKLFRALGLKWVDELDDGFWEDEEESEV